MKAKHQNPYRDIIRCIGQSRDITIGRRDGYCYMTVAHNDKLIAHVSERLSQKFFFDRGFDYNDPTPYTIVNQAKNIRLLRKMLQKSFFLLKILNHHRTQHFYPIFSSEDDYLLWRMLVSTTPNDFTYTYMLGGHSGIALDLERFAAHVKPQNTKPESEDWIPL